MKNNKNYQVFFYKILTNLLVNKALQILVKVQFPLIDALRSQNKIQRNRSRGLKKT